MPKNSDRWEPRFHRKLRDLLALVQQEGVRKDQERTRPLVLDRPESGVDLRGIPRLPGLKPHTQYRRRSFCLAQLRFAPRVRRIPKNSY